MHDFWAVNSLPQKAHIRVYLIFISPYFTPKFVSSCVTVCQGVSHRLTSRLDCRFVVMLILKFQQILLKQIINIVLYRITRRVCRNKKERHVSLLTICVSIR